MEAKVRSFNNLPRPEKTPSGLVSNHWVFGVCLFDINPPGDLVMAVNPQSHYVLQRGPGQILSLPTTREKAAATTPYLLDAFANLNPIYASTPTFAPWTWSTLDPDMARAIEDGLKELGVKPELCKVTVCTAEEREILETVRAAVFKEVTGLMGNIERDPVALGDSTKRHGCGIKNQCFFQPLKKCARCSEAYHHSRECQKKHWKKHKSVCSTPGTAPSLDAVQYYNQKAPTDPEARALMSSLRLDGHPKGSGTALPLRRLILTGQDTPENLRLLFGPDYETTLKKKYEDIRLECLLDPPPGSPSRLFYGSMEDPSLSRSLRPATEAENKKVKEVRDMQALIVQRGGPGKVPSPADRQAIMDGFGRNAVAKFPTYILALNRSGRSTRQTSALSRDNGFSCQRCHEGASGELGVN